ncbi:sulfurtransferase [Corynebacterium occultum]|uniref:sulfurtransferase n=1 Tax=Corynebacterium occultum TaxID=2675219 RepID=UPI001E403C95|nr:sulfurtransferase [Corynebacterium occultum]
MSTNLISPQELRSELAGENPPQVLDVRWTLGKPEGVEEFEAGHVPGARYVSLDRDLSDLDKDHLGRHPLPNPGTIDDLMQRLGLSLTSSVVVYDDWNRAGSSRAWWVLRSAGLKDIRILDGGWSGWVAAEGEVESGESTEPIDSEPVAIPDLYRNPVLPVLTPTQAGELAQSGTLLDARPGERFAGEANPEGESPGHIPGARNLPSAELLDEQGFFRPKEELEELFDAAGATAGTDTGAYCGSGVTACVVIAAAAAIDREVALYPGSWSQWSAEPDAPAELGRG